VQEEEHPVGVRYRGGKPVGRHAAGVHLCHQHVDRDRMKAARGGEASTALFECRRGLVGTGLLPIPEGVDQVRHCLAWHVGTLFGRSSLRCRLDLAEETRLHVEDKAPHWDVFGDPRM